MCDPRHSPLSSLINITESKQIERPDIPRLVCQCSSLSYTSFSDLVAIGHGRSVTAMAGTSYISSPLNHLIQVTHTAIAYEGQSGSKDRGDPEVCLYLLDETKTSLCDLTGALPQTSNVFVANLPPHVTEQSLGTFFARAGPVGSVSPSFSLFSPDSL